MLKQPKYPINLWSIAPMMGWTTRHYRYFLRLISKKVALYTEMITTGAILHHKQRKHLLGFSSEESPLAIQLGGSIPADLAAAAKIAEELGYSEINLNVGCPSNRVQSGCFGAVLFKDPAKVAECVAALQSAVNIPVTVKTRIGVDDQDSYEALMHFIDKVSQMGCQTFIIHARKAWLNGLSPKDNRRKPPLNYERVYQLKRNFPHLTIIINGGIENLTQGKIHLDKVDGVMIGRAAWYQPYLFRELELQALGSVEETIKDRLMILQQYMLYAKPMLQQGENISYLLQPLFGLFHGLKGAKQWRVLLVRAIQNKQLSFLSEWKLNDSIF